MIKKNIFLPLLLLFAGFPSFAQPLSWMGETKPYKWMFGIGWNAVDDDGRPFCQPFDVNQSWNYQYYPTRLTVDRYLKRGLSVEFAGAYNNYTAGKLVNNSTNLNGLFLSFDLNCKYSFYNLLRTDWLDPYASLGVGGTYRDAYPTTFQPTLNAALGVNFFFYRGFGLQLQTSGKFGINADFYTTTANYLQHSVGFVYKMTPSTQQKGQGDKKRYGWTKKKYKYKAGKKNGR